MVDKIFKILAKLNKADKDRIDSAIERLGSDWKNAGDIKPLKNKKGYFRLRVGKFRIIFIVLNDEAFVLKVGKRSDVFYK